MSNVWVPWKGIKHDIEKAAKWGTIVEVFEGRSIASPLALFDQRKVIVDEVLPMSFKDDFILIAGPQIVVLNFVITWMNHHGFAKCLVYKRSVDDFVEKRFDLLQKRC